MQARTPLFDQHEALNGRMVDFGGWALPVHYGSQIEEHHAVRRAAGMFDVSHMTVVDLKGVGVRELLRYLLANDVARLKEPGRALYSCMLNPAGGVIDDLIAYSMDDTFFRLVVNAATRAKDLAWVGQQAQAFAVTVTERPELAMLAVQGPQARARVHSVLDPAVAQAVAELGRFRAHCSTDLFAARTGYTGEDGYELIVPAAAAPELWQALAGADVTPCGLGARDTLRLEAGLNLYGQDMDEETTPAESGLQWTVAMDDGGRDFCGRVALAEQLQAGPARVLVGLVLEGRGVLRHGQAVITGQGEGSITSGTYSPTLEQSIAFARLPAAHAETVEVDIRGRLVPARVVSPPFVKMGQPNI